MVSTLRGFAVLPAVVLIAACGGAPQTTAAGDTAPIDEVRNRYVAAYNAGDAAGVAALYADDAISMPDHRPALEGKAAIERDLQNVFNQYNANITLTPGETEVVGDIAHEHGTYSVTMMPKAGGNTMNETGKYLVILKRGGGGAWLLHHDIDNTNAPPNPTAQPGQP